MTKNRNPYEMQNGCSTSRERTSIWIAIDQFLVFLSCHLCLPTVVVYCRVLVSSIAAPYQNWKLRHQFCCSLIVRNGNWNRLFVLVIVYCVNWELRSDLDWTGKKQFNWTWSWKWTKFDPEAGQHEVLSRSMEVVQGMGRVHLVISNPIHYNETPPRTGYNYWASDLLSRSRGKVFYIQYIEFIYSNCNWYISVFVRFKLILIYWYTIYRTHTSNC